MSWSKLVLALGLAACGAPVAPPPVPEPAVAPSTVAETAELVAAIAAYRKEPSQAAQDAVNHACDRAMKVATPTPALDVAIGDGVSNVLLRPDLGLPYLEKEKDHLDKAGVDAWLSALLRGHKPDLLSSEYKRLIGPDPLDIEHPAIHAIMDQAAADPTMTWVDARDGIEAARMIEEEAVTTHGPIDRPVDSAAALFEAFGMLLDGWDCEAATGRSTLSSDPDPVTTSHVVTAWDDKRRVLGYVRSTNPAILRKPGEELDKKLPLHVIVVAFQAHSKAVGGIFFGATAKEQDKGLYLFDSTSPGRMTTIADAADLLTDLRKAGKTDAEIGAALREKYLKQLIASDHRPD